MFELLGDVGGLIAIVWGGLSIVTDYFAEIRIDAIFAETAYRGQQLA